MLVLDWLGKSRHLPGAPAEGLAILDHKTSKDPTGRDRRSGRPYGIFTEADALDDPQQLIYRARFQVEFARWLYYRKTRAILGLELEAERELYMPDEYEMKLRGVARQPISPKVFVSNLQIPISKVQSALESVVLVSAERIVRAKEKGRVDPLTVAPNPSHCDEYGGCQFKETCNLSPMDMIAGSYTTKEEEDMGSIFDKVGAPPQATPVNGGAAFQAPETPGASDQDRDEGGTKEMPPANWNPNPDYRKTERGTYAPVNAPVNAPVTQDALDLELGRALRTILNATRG